MDGQTLLLVAIASFVSFLIGRWSQKSEIESLRFKHKTEELRASRQAVEIAELIDDFNELAERYNARLVPVSKPKSKAKAQARSTEGKPKVSAAPRPLEESATASAAKEDALPQQVVSSLPVIVTRTSSLPPGTRAIDNWVEKSDWLSGDDARLKAAINNGDTVFAIAVSMNIDQKDVAHRATRLYSDEWGDLDNKAKAPFDGTTWTKSQKAQFDELVSAGKSISSIAEALGRTKIAIGWRMIDNRKMRF